MYKDPQKPRLYRNRYRQAIHGLAAFSLPLYRPSRQDRGASSQPTPLICISRGVIGPRRAAIGAATDPADVSWTTPACDDRAPCNPPPPPQPPVPRPGTTEGKLNGFVWPERCQLTQTASPTPGHSNRTRFRTLVRESLKGVDVDEELDKRQLSDSLILFVLTC